MTLSAKPKFPIFGLGQAYNGGIIADATIELRSSGLVGTAYGFPGISATLIGTGLYDVRFAGAAARGIRVFPEAVAPNPSGTAVPPTVPTNTLPQFGVSVANLSGPSGSMHVQTWTQSPQASGVTGNFGSGMHRPINAGTGASINLQFLISPISRY